jgi:hypothetical protein
VPNNQLLNVGNPPITSGPAWDQNGNLIGPWSKFFFALSFFAQMFQLGTGGLPVYANNAAAIAGKLQKGQFYRTGADPDYIAVVH